MIKLKPLYEAAAVIMPKDYGNKKTDDFVTIPTATDKETGKQSWDVMYTNPDKRSKRIMFSKTYQTLRKLADEFEYVSTLSTYKDDGEMHTFAKTLRTLEERFREYIEKKSKG